MNGTACAAAHPLDNVFWQTLVGPHARYAFGSAEARRYAPGFSPIVGFANPESPDFAALAPHCTPGERFYCCGWEGAAPAGWQIEMEARICRMVWRMAMPEGDEATGAVLLEPRHVAQALELAELTRPGPFGSRTPELGEYFGFIENGTLVAMAGERMHARGHREISGVCTLPAHRGRGLARRLMLKLVARQMMRGETPFLHAMVDNVAARALYERMGFREDRESTLRVVRYAGSPR